MKILLAVDDSRYFQAAIQSVLQKAHPQDTEVRFTFLSRSSKPSGPHTMSTQK